MKLILMRHGDSEKFVIHGDRPLTQTGEREADAAGFFLRASGVKPDIIMHSSRLRSAMTAERVMAVAGAGVLAFRKDLEEDSSPEGFLASVASEFADTEKIILAVGHNPFISRLGSLMICPESHAVIANFKTGALLGADSVNSGKYWDLRFFATPKVIAGIYNLFDLS